LFVPLVGSRMLLKPPKGGYMGKESQTFVRRDAVNIMTAVIIGAAIGVAAYSVVRDICKVPHFLNTLSDKKTP
jgi:hypothetical protein